MSKILSIWINNSLTNNAKQKLRVFRFAYSFKTQYNGSGMFYAIVRMVQPDTRAGFSDINSKLKNMKMYQFKHDIPLSYLYMKE